MVTTRAIRALCHHGIRCNKPVWKKSSSARLPLWLTYRFILITVKSGKKVSGASDTDGDWQGIQWTKCILHNNAELMSNFGCFLRYRILSVRMGQLEILLRRQLPGRYSVFIKRITGNLLNQYNLFRGDRNCSEQFDCNIVDYSLLAESRIHAISHVSHPSSQSGAVATNWIIALVGFSFELMDYVAGYCCRAQSAHFWQNNMLGAHSVSRFVSDWHFVLIIRFLKNCAWTWPKLRSECNLRLWDLDLRSDRIYMTTIIQSSSANLIGLMAIYLRCIDFSSAALFRIGSK